MEVRGKDLLNGVVPTEESLPILIQSKTGARQRRKRTRLQPCRNPSVDEVGEMVLHRVTPIP